MWCRHSWQILIPRLSEMLTPGLTHWGQVTHICVGKTTIIGSDNGLSPGWHPPVIWTNAGILLTGPLGTNFSEISIDIHAFSFKKTHLKMLSGKWSPFCLGLNALNDPTEYIAFWRRCYQRKVCAFKQNFFCIMYAANFYLIPICWEIA